MLMNFSIWDGRLLRQRKRLDFLSICKTYNGLIIFNLSITLVYNKYYIVLCDTQDSDVKVERLLREAELAETFSILEADRYYEQLEGMAEQLQQQQFKDLSIKV